MSTEANFSDVEPCWNCDTIKHVECSAICFCMTAYDDHDHQALVLECGHTLCKQCYQTLTAQPNGGCCPYCRNSNMERPRDNFSISSISQSLYPTGNIHRPTTTKRKRLRTSIKHNIDTVAHYADVMLDNLTALKEEYQKEWQAMDVKLRKINKHLEEIHNKITPRREMQRILQEHQNKLNSEKSKQEKKLETLMAETTDAHRFHLYALRTFEEDEISDGYYSADIIRTATDNLEIKMKKQEKLSRRYAHTEIQCKSVQTKLEHIGTSIEKQSMKRLSAVNDQCFVEAHQRQLNDKIEQLTTQIDIIASIRPEMKNSKQLLSRGFKSAP